MMTTADFTASGGEHAQRNQNLLDTVALMGAMALLTAISAFQFFSWPGLAAAALFIGAISFGAPHVPAAMVMRLYRATPVDRRHGGDLYRVLDDLSLRAGLATAPALYVVPSLTMNAFSVGTPGNAAIAVTEGLLRKLSLRQLTGVLAHELSHVRNNDLRIHALADGLTRAMQVLSWVALAMILFYLPQYIAGVARPPWLGLMLLYLGPTACTLMQTALSRTREYEADLDAVTLTGDPGGLASALRLIERYEGRFWEDLVFPHTRRVPQPSILRTHPATETRIERLRRMTPPQPALPPMLPGQDSPRVSLIGMAPSQMRPRYRVPGIWF